jgi:hypothetical protein
MVEEVEDPFEIITIVITPDGSIEVEPGGMDHSDVVFALWKALCLLGNPGFVTEESITMTFPGVEDEEEEDP